MVDFLNKDNPNGFTTVENEWITTYFIESGFASGISTNFNGATESLAPQKWCYQYQK
jgi:hypothetical protein